MTLWWMKPGWIETCCANCGARIAPEGDPDWGLCFSCFSAQLEDRERASEEGYAP